MGTSTHFTKPSSTTCATPSPALLRVGRIIRVAGMAMRAVSLRFGKRWAHSSYDVLRLSDGFKVASTHTVPTATEVIRYLLVSKCSPREEVGETVRPHQPTITEKGSVAIAKLPSGPEPTPPQPWTMIGYGASLVDLLPEPLFRRQESLIVTSEHVGAL